MKKLGSVIRLLSLVAVVSFANVAQVNIALAEEQATANQQPSANMSNNIPTTEKEFVAAINQYDKKQIIEKLGEPSKAEDVRIKGSDKVVASIWHYHFLNTAPDGSYYQTTELDFIEDKVVVVVFLNNDGSEGAEGGQKYDMPSNPAENSIPAAI